MLVLLIADGLSVTGEHIVVHQAQLVVIDGYVHAVGRQDADCFAQSVSIVRGGNSQRVQIGSCESDHLQPHQRHVVDE